MATYEYEIWHFDQLMVVLRDASRLSPDNGVADDYVINVQQGGTLWASTDAWAVNLWAGDRLIINGRGGALDGQDVYRGLFVYGGTVIVNDFTIRNTVAQGGHGGNGGGGGAGLGGALMVAAGDVTLNDV